MERIIGGFMEWLRVKHKQSIKATSKIIGVNEHTLRRWENGLTSPDILKFKEYMNNYGNERELAALFFKYLLEINKLSYVKAEDVIFYSWRTINEWCNPGRRGIPTVPYIKCCNILIERVLKTYGK